MQVKKAAQYDENICVYIQYILYVCIGYADTESWLEQFLVTR